VGETRVDLVHLLEDLRDAYPGSLEETILTEVVANALDSGARTLHLRTEASSSTLVAIDDGSGMTRRELARYHDLATTSKRRGRGIGFAGVGIKLGLLACTEVVTETRRGRQHIATSWRLAHRSRAPWSWIEPPRLLEADGTAVLMTLANPLSELLDPGFVENAVIRHFQALFEPEFLDILAGVYPRGFSILLNGAAVVGPIRPAARYPLAIRIGRQRKPSAIGYLARHDDDLPEHERGLAISTMGKVIRRGWDWIGITPDQTARIEGLIEVPALAEALTLNKGDFLRAGARGALYLAYRRAIQEAVTAQLEAWGSTPPPPRPSTRSKPFERDLRKVLGDLAEDYPVLATLAERRSGGQRRLPLGAPSGAPGQGVWSGQEALIPAAAGVPSESYAETRTTGNSPERPAPDGSADREPHAQELSHPESGSGGAAESLRHEPSTLAPVGLPGPARRRRASTLSLEIRFESRPGEVSLGRLLESTVWVNDAHPAYRRAVASRAEGYHIALSVAAALAPLTVEAQLGQDFINRFLARWGEAAGKNGRPGQ
jgi:hypothetical protein